MKNQEKITTRINKRIFKKLKEEFYIEDKSFHQAISNALLLGLKTESNVSSDLFLRVLASRKITKFITNEEERYILDSSCYSL